MRVANYDHNLKGLMQEMCDHLIEQGVLGISQEENVQVQAVCPSFLERKQRGKDKPKHIVIFDLNNSFFQNHMARDALAWLGMITAFGGLRIMKRSSQGLVGQSEEIKLKEGICAKITDDIYVGGQSQEEAAANYIRILRKLALANLKVSPAKTKIFPHEASVLGWVWKRGGQIEASPHRKCSLLNAKEDNIYQVRHMRGFLGLYKTLHMATPAISQVLVPLEEEVAGALPGDKFQWTHKATQRFCKAKSHLDKVSSLYRPIPDDQLMIKPDGSTMTPANGYVIYAIKDGQLRPVHYHSVKLKDEIKKRSPWRSRSWPSPLLSIQSTTCSASPRRPSSSAPTSSLWPRPSN